MSFDIDFIQSNPGFFGAGKFIDLTNRVENTTYSSPCATNMVLGDTPVYGRDNLGIENQTGQSIQLQTSSNKQKIQKPEKKKRKKNTALRHAIKKNNIQKGQQELEVERNQVLLAAINQEQNSTRSYDLTGHKLSSGIKCNLKEARAKEALDLDDKQSELRQSQITKGPSAKEKNKKIDKVSTTMENQVIIKSKEHRVLAGKKVKVIPNLRKKRKKGSDPDGTNSMILNSAHANGYIPSTDTGNSLNTCNRADNQILDTLNERDNIKILQVSGIMPNSVSVSKEKQKGLNPISFLNQEPIQAKGISFSQTNPRKRQKKAIKPKSISMSCHNKNIANQEENLNLPRNIPVIDLSSPAPAKNVLSKSGETNNICPKKNRSVKSQRKQAINSTVRKPKKQQISKRAIKNQIRRIKRLEWKAVSQVSSSNDNNHKTGPDNIDIPNQVVHGNEKTNQEDQEQYEEQEKFDAQEQYVEQDKREGQKNFESSLKEIPEYLEPYRTDTEKEVLSLMRELLGIVR